MKKKKIKKHIIKKKRTKKRKFVRPPTGLQTRGQGKNPHSAITYHKGYVHDKVRYTVLTVAQMPEVIKRIIAAELKPVVTGTQAKMLPDGVNGWRCFVADMHGRVLILSYRGVEVSVFFKRQLTTIEPQPGDHFPEGVCQDPEEAWQRLDLMGLSAKKANLVIASTHQRQDEEITTLKAQVETLTTLNDELEDKYRRITIRKEKEQAKAKKARRR